MELIGAEIIDMAPIGPGHASWVEGLAAALITELGPRAIVRPQLPVRLGSHSEPQPDIAAVAPRVDRYRSAHPTAADVLLLVEISRSRLRFDLDVKAPLCARHGIPELWSVDLNVNEVHFCSAPRGGAYTAATTTVPGGLRALIAFPDVVIDLSLLA